MANSLLTARIFTCEEVGIFLSVEEWEKYLEDSDNNLYFFADFNLFFSGAEERVLFITDMQAKTGHAKVYKNSLNLCPFFLFSAETQYITFASFRNLKALMQPSAESRYVFYKNVYVKVKGI